MPKIEVIIPVFNEERSIGKVVAEIPREWVREVVVCNNGSTDQTAAVARAAGAVVVDEPRKGYGSACLKGIAWLNAKPPGQRPDIVVFIDGDYSDFPEEIPALVAPILQDGMDLVIGSRVLGAREKGALTPQQIFGNWLATTLIRIIYRYSFTDLGPFRAIRFDSLMQLDMRDPDFGWTVEMQVRAAKMGMRCSEIPVKYRKRIGVSKVSGTLRGVLLAGHKILWTIFKLI
jgi:glycosyltransferase involved in cell wall biosynthesis